MPPPVAAQSPQPGSIFTFESDEFWFNLHHFLYVLGRGEAKMADASRAGVTLAVADAERGIKSLTDEERKTWAATVGVYASGISKLDAVRGEPFPTIDLPHAMIFFTTGEAVRRVEPAHVPYADTLGIWSLQLSGARRPAERLKGPLEETWRPYLNGGGTRDQALAALLARVGVKSAQ